MGCGISNSPDRLISQENIMVKKGMINLYALSQRMYDWNFYLGLVVFHTHGICFWTVVTRMYLLWLCSFTLWCYRGFRSTVMWHYVAWISGSGSREGTYRPYLWVSGSQEWPTRTPEHAQRHRITFPNTGILIVILGAFEKLWKAAVSFPMSVCLSVCMEQLGSHWMEFHEIFSCHRPECLYGYMKEIP